METTSIFSWPTDESKVWLNPYFFLHNWSSNFLVKSRWFTDISTNRNAGEIRVGLVNRPYRTLSAHYTNMSKSQALNYQMMLAKMGKSRFWFPLYSDVSLLTSAVTSNAITTTTSQPITIYCDTSDRRFYVGKYIAIAKVEDSVAPYVDILEILSVSSTYIIASGSIENDYPAGSKVLPLIIGKVITTENHESITDTAMDGNISVEEVIGKTSLPASSTDNSITTDYSETVSPTGSEYPILDMRPDWRDTTVGHSRISQVSSSGRGEFLQTYGERPLIQKSMSLSFVTRASAFEFLKLFDSRKGRLNPLYIFSDINEYSEIYDISSDRKQIAIEYTGPKVNWTFRPYIGIRLKDGTHIVRKVSDVLATITTTFEPLTTTADPGATLEYLTFETPLPAFSLSNVLRLHVAYLARFDIDELEENWITDTVMQCSVSFVELDEKDIESQINYYGTTTIEPTTTGAACNPWFVTDWDWNGGTPLLEDACMTASAGYFNGFYLYMTSGNASGNWAVITSWGGPGNPWYVLESLHPISEWDVQIGDGYRVEPPE